MGTVHLLDISMDVPQGVTVTIPAAKATRSKDLWRLIAQKQLMRLNPGPGAPEPPPAPPMTEADKLREDNAMLHEQNRLLKLTFEQPGGKLDAILGGDIWRLRTTTRGPFRQLPLRRLSGQPSFPRCRPTLWRSRPRSTSQRRSSRRASSPMLR